MKRFAQSVGIFLLGAHFLGLAVWLLWAMLGVEFPEWLVTVFAYLFGWPLLLIEPFVPASDSPDPHAPSIRLALYFFALLLDVLAYSLLIYGVLCWRAKRTRLP